VRDHDAALDIVQDAMLRLTEKYGDRPAADLPLLFHRIMQNAIRDWYRRQKVRSLWIVPFAALTGARGEDDGREDPLETLTQAGEQGGAETPPQRLERSQLVEILEEEIAQLPERQREAFLMRYLHELDVAETALAMGCSEGSVKTHCSRAAHALASALKARGIEL
jgi:RNA polymerase sigma-70 factor (ECF subfamily)